MVNINEVKSWSFIMINCNDNKPIARQMGREKPVFKKE